VVKIKALQGTMLEYKFKNDTLFKMVFTKNPHLLKRLVAVILRIRIEDIEEFTITNPDMTPEEMGNKFCHLDIMMTVNGQRVNLEIQVEDEGDYTERALYYWARAYSTALNAGGEYINLPRTIVISIIGFKQFDCPEFHSEYQILEVKRHTPLNDKFDMYFFELPKLSDVDSAEDELELWLALFNAETEEDLEKIKALGVDVMEQAIGAFLNVAASKEFRELERIRSLTRHNEASALGHARREGRREGEQLGAEREREIWQGVVADKDTALAEQAAEIARLRAQLGK